MVWSCRMRTRNGVRTLGLGKPLLRPWLQHPGQFAHLSEASIPFFQFGIITRIAVTPDLAVVIIIWERRCISARSIHHPLAFMWATQQTPITREIWFWESKVKFISHSLPAPRGSAYAPWLRGPSSIFKTSRIASSNLSVSSIVTSLSLLLWSHCLLSCWPSCLPLRRILR